MNYYILTIIYVLSFYSKFWNVVLPKANITTSLVISSLNNGLFSIYLANASSSETSPIVYFTNDFLTCVVVLENVLSL